MSIIIKNDTKFIFIQNVRHFIIKVKLLNIVDTLRSENEVTSLAMP